MSDTHVDTDVEIEVLHNNVLISEIKEQSRRVDGSKVSSFKKSALFVRGDNQVHESVMKLSFLGYSLCALFKYLFLESVSSVFDLTQYLHCSMVHWHHMHDKAFISIHLEGP